MSAFWSAGSGTTEGEDRASSQGAGVGAAGPNPVFPMSFSIETIIADERDLLPRMRALTWSAMSWQHGAGRRDVLGSRAREAEPACKTKP